jgi:hypothetical protein
MLENESLRLDSLNEYRQPETAVDARTIVHTILMQKDRISVEELSETRICSRGCVLEIVVQLSEPAVGAPEDLRGAALVAAIFGDGAARDGPFGVIKGV